jgi:hypothetical protein
VEVPDLQHREHRDDDGCGVERPLPDGMHGAMLSDAPARVKFSLTIGTVEVRTRARCWGAAGDRRRAVTKCTGRCEHRLREARFRL